MPKSNEHVLEYVDAYLHDALPSSDRQTVAAHCETCPICRVALDEAKKRLEAMQSLPPVEASEDLIRATLQRIERHRPPKITLARAAWALAASIALVLVGMHSYYSLLEPSPYDLRVLGQSELLAGSEASLRVLVVDQRNGQPVVGVPVEIELSGPRQPAVQLAQFTTDAQGTATPRLRLPDWGPGQYQLRVRAATRGPEESIVHPVQLKRAWQLMVTSDKPVYQPGQVIHVRSLALARPDLKPVAGQETTFSITDPKGNVVLRKRDVTSKFGIASMDCPLATEVLEGAYKVECTVGDTSGAVSVEVKKYVLPKFKVSLELDQPYYQPGQKAKGTVEARYFFGKPVQDAEVQVEVQAIDVGPSVVFRTTTRTSREGMAHFEFAVPPSLVGRDQDSGEARLTAAAVVTDSAGQKQARTTSRTVTAQPIRIEVIPESGRLAQGIPNTVYLVTTYPDGRPARTRLAISGVATEATTNELGVGLVELTPQSQEIGWTIRATDASGLAARREAKLRCGPPTGDFLVRTDKAVYDGGQTLHVVALGGGTEPVFVDLLKDGQTLLTNSVPMANGRGQFELDIPPELFGTVELCAYRYGQAGLPVKKTRVLYLRPARGLNIETKLDQAEYRPGKRARLAFALTDREGRATPGGLSLAAVDEAVFSVLEQRPGMERTFFTLERELLKPVYEIHGWSPDSPSPGTAEARIQFEQALFATAAQSGERRAAALPCGAVVLHNLVAESYPQKMSRIAEARDKGLARVRTGWGWFFVGGGGVLLVVGAVRLQILQRLWRGAANPNRLAWMFLAIIVVGFVALLMPADSRPRAPGRRVFDSKAATDSEVVKADVSREKWRQAVPSSPAEYDTKRGKDVPGDDAAGGGGPAEPVRVREWFPETLLWRPELITDENGRATLDLDLADSITTWRLAASAVSADGRLGGTLSGVRVFQPFFVDLDLPVALTRGDEVSIPAVVYNYLDKPQTVQLTLADAPWAERLDEPTRKLELAPGDVRSVSFRIRARTVGKHQLQMTAQAGSTADAIQREIEIVPDGRRIEQTAGGTLDQPRTLEWNVPAGIVPGSVKAMLRIYPSNFSQLVEGMDAIFRQPYGCFEQTSSTTYPNVLALDYLRRNHKTKTAPEVEAKAKQYIHLGYQRLLTFEVPGGGFDWFGHAPANRTLTAYGLMEFADMARVHDVDPNLLARTRQWLVAARQPDGSWQPDSRGHWAEDPARPGELARLNATAYIAWAVFSGHDDDPEARTTLGYLVRHEPASLDDPYLLALMANALQAIQPDGRAAGPYLDRLASIKKTSPDGKLAWWEQKPGGRTAFYGDGRAGSIETTALAAIALLNAQKHPATTRAALAWLVQQKDDAGTWRSTQATVLALKALLAGTGKSLGGDQERRIDVALDGQRIRGLTIAADQQDVVQQVDLASQLGSGAHRLELTDRTGASTGYQATLSYHVPGSSSEAAAKQPLEIEVTYDRKELTVDDTLVATARVSNRMAQTAPMVILDLPIPAGFAVQTDDFARATAAGTIARYQATARSVIVYLRGLEPGQPLTLRYSLRAVMPVRVTAPPAKVYEYYDRDKHASTAPVPLIVAAKRG